MITLYAVVQSVVLYLLLFIIRFVVVLSGVIAIPLAYPFKRNNHLPGWAWVWDNREDGIYGPYWFNNGVENFKTCFLWSAIRNPANNMRFIDLFNVTHRQGIIARIYGDEEVPEPQRARKLGRSMWHFTLVRQKGVWYFSWWYLRPWNEESHFRIRIGWKCTQEWIKKPRADIYRDSGMTFQLMLKRSG